MRPGSSHRGADTRQCRGGVPALEVVPERGLTFQCCTPAPAQHPSPQLQGREGCKAGGIRSSTLSTYVCLQRFSANTFGKKAGEGLRPTAQAQWQRPCPLSCPCSLPPATAIQGGPVSPSPAPPSPASSAGSGPDGPAEPLRPGLGVLGSSPPHFTGPRGGPEGEAAGPLGAPKGSLGVGTTLRVRQSGCRAGLVLRVTLSFPVSEEPTL